MGYRPYLSPLSVDTHVCMHTHTYQLQLFMAVNLHLIPKLYHLVWKPNSPSGQSQITSKVGGKDHSLLPKFVFLSFTDMEPRIWVIYTRLPMRVYFLACPAQFWPTGCEHKCLEAVLGAFPRKLGGPGSPPAPAAVWKWWLVVKSSLPTTRWGWKAREGRAERCRGSGVWALSNGQPGLQAWTAHLWSFMRENKVLSCLRHCYLEALLAADKSNHSFYKSFFFK